jgi:hypothetical protein
MVAPPNGGNTRGESMSNPDVKFLGAIGRSRTMWVLTPSDDWKVGDLVPFCWDGRDGEFGGHIKVLGKKEDGTWRLDYVPAAPAQACADDAKDILNSDELGQVGMKEGV